MFAELQGMVDNSVAYVEELLGAQQRPPVDPECVYTAWFKKVVKTTWIQNPQSVYNLVAIIVALTVIATGIHHGWKQLHSIKARRAVFPAPAAAAPEASPVKPASRAVAQKPAPKAEAPAAESKANTRSASRRAASKKADASSSSRSRSASAKSARPKRGKKL